MRRYMILAAACGLLATGYAHADQLPCRAAWSDMRAKLTAEPTLAKISELPANLREIAQANFNAIPPASDETFAHIYAATSDKHPDQMLVVFARTDECVVIAAAFLLDQFRELLTKASHEKGQSSDHHPAGNGA